MYFNLTTFFNLLSSNQRAYTHSCFLIKTRNGRQVEIVKETRIIVLEKLLKERKSLYFESIFIIALDTICRNLPFGGRATRGSRVRLPWEENARSRHQRLFEENVRKTRKGGLRTFNSERFGSCIYARGRY